MAQLPPMSTTMLGDVRDEIESARSLPPMPQEEAGLGMPSNMYSQDSSTEVSTGFDEAFSVARVDEQPAISMQEVPTLQESEISALDKYFAHATTAEGTTLHFDSRPERYITMPFGIVPDANSITLNGKPINPRMHTVTDANLANVDTSAATKNVRGTVIRRDNYESDEAFARAVFGEFENVVKQEYPDYDAYSDGQKKFLLDMAVNAGASRPTASNPDGGGLLWDSTKKSVEEMSKPDPDYFVVYQPLQNFRSGGNWSIGLLRRRAMALNLMLPEDRQIDSVRATQLDNGKIRYEALDPSNSVVFSTNKKQDNETPRTLSVDTGETLAGPEFAEDGVHIVSAGENLSAIARENDITVQQLTQWNGIQNPNQIRAGQQLRLTPPQEEN